MRRRSAAVLMGVVLMFLPAVAPRGEESPPPKTVVIKMTARKDQLSPETVTVRQGDRVRLIVTALDGKREFRLDDYGIDQILLKGDPAIIEFTASKPGTFTFRCLSLSGRGHKKLKGSLVVSPRP
jgi:cytochrome c oxidase subunit II